MLGINRLVLGSVRVYRKIEVLCPNQQSLPVRWEGRGSRLLTLLSPESKTRRGIFACELLAALLWSATAPRECVCGQGYRECFRGPHSEVGEWVWEQISKEACEAGGGELGLQSKDHAGGKARAAEELRGCEEVQERAEKGEFGTAFKRTNNSIKQNLDSCSSLFAGRGYCVCGSGFTASPTAFLRAFLLI